MISQNKPEALTSNECRPGALPLPSANERKAIRGKLAAAYAMVSSSPADAAALAESALSAARLRHEPLLHGEAALLLAECHLMRSDLIAAEALIVEALSTFERAGKRNLLGRAYQLQMGLFSMQERVSLALAAGSRALKYPDLQPKDRAVVFCVIGICISRVSDLASGLVTLEQRALPEADLARDSATIVKCYLRAAALAHNSALWSAGIPNYMTVGMKRTSELLSESEYLEKAMRYLLVAETHGAASSAASGAYFFGLKGSVVASLNGFESARSIFAQGHASATDRLPRAKLALLVSEGTAARIAQRCERAVEVLEEARRQPGAHYLQRPIAFELAQAYRALGRSDEALTAFEEFARLQSSMAILEKSGGESARGRRRRGEPFDLRLLRASVLQGAEPPELKRASQYIEENLGRPLTLSEVARHAGCSVRTLQHWYKNFRGVSASAFVKDRKLQHAHSLLAARVSVNQVSNAIGYSSPANFCRAFRGRFGCPPSDIQRMTHTA